jgi:hypothetical protein
LTFIKAHASTAKGEYSLTAIPALPPFEGVRRSFILQVHWQPSAVTRVMIIGSTELL